MGNKPIGITCKISEPLRQFLVELKNRKKLKSYAALLLYVAQENGYKIQPEDL